MSHQAPRRFFASLGTFAALAVFMLLPSCGVVREMTIQSEQDGIIREVAAMSDNPEFQAPEWAREWAGEYYVGDGTGMNVRVLLGPKSDIVYTWRGCLGLYDHGSGLAEGTFDEDGDGAPDGLLINWTTASNARCGFGSRKWYFVRWPGPNGAEGRKYFVPEDQMMHLVNNYNEGGFARDGLFLAPRKEVRVDGKQVGASRRDTPVEGPPQLPSRWAAMLIAVPFDAHVISVTPTATRDVATTSLANTQSRATLDKGRADRLYTGMKIRVGGWSSGSGSLTIDRVEEHTAEGTFEVTNERALIPTPLVVGQAIRIGGTTKEEQREAMSR